MSRLVPSGLLRRLRGRAGDRQGGFAEAGVAVTGAALVLGAALGSGVASTVVTMSDGVTWLPDDTTGQVVQVNPGTGQAERRLQVGEPGSELGISQQDGRLVITDGRTGTVRSIDLSTLLSGGTRVPSEPSRVLVGGGRVYLVATGSGLVRAVDPLTLQDLGPAYRAQEQLADAVVDAHGSVWVATTSGSVRPVTWEPDDARFDVGTARRVRGAGAGTRLLPHARGVTVFAPDGSRVQQVGVGRDLTVQVPGLVGEVLPAATAPTDLAPAAVPGRSAVVVLAGDRVLDVAVGALGCERPGRPAVFTGLVFVPCTGAGRVVVLRGDGTRARADVLLPGGLDPRLLVDDGRLVVHTEDGARAVVVEADGRTRVVDTGRARVVVHDPRDGGTSAVTAQPPTLPAAPAVPGGADATGVAGGWVGDVLDGTGGRGGAGGQGGAGDQGGAGGQGGADGQGGAGGQGGTSGTGDPTPGPSGGVRTPAPGAPGRGGATPSPSSVAPPTDVEATAGDADDAGLSDVVVTWRPASARPDAYVVRSTLAGAVPVEVDARTTRVTVRGVACGARGTVTVEAVRGGALSAPASSPTVRTDACPAAPAAPTGVTAVPAADGSVTVSWRPSADRVDTYLVGPAGGSTTTVDAMTTTTVLRDVPPGTDVRFGVRAVRAGVAGEWALSSGVVVPGVPGALTDLTATLDARLDRELQISLRFSAPAPVQRFVVTWSGDGVAGSTDMSMVTGCQRGGCGPDDPPRSTLLGLVVPCVGPALCASGGPLTVTVAGVNGVGAGPSSAVVVDVPPATGRTTVIAGVEPVVPAPDDPDVRMVVHLAPPAVFTDHPAGCLLDVEHADGTRTSTAWSCQPGDVVVGPFPPGVVTVTARTVGTAGEPAIGSMPARAEVPPRDLWPSCDPAAGCVQGAALVHAPVTVVPVPWSPRLPAGPERPPLAATGAGLLLAAGALHLRRLRRTVAPTAPHVTTEESPA